MNKILKCLYKHWTELKIYISLCSVSYQELCQVNHLNVLFHMVFSWL